MKPKDSEHKVISAPTMLPAQNALHPMANAILAANPTPDTLRELMALDREWRRDVAKKAYTQALVNLKRELPPFIDKDAEVDFTGAKGRVNYRHASFAGASVAIKEPLENNGFAITFPNPAVAPDGKSVTVTARLTHMEGHYEEATLSGPPDLSGSKNALQGIASAVTYLQRYTTLLLLGLATAGMKEPAGDSHNGDRIDTDRNIQAVNHFIKLGRKKGEVEAYVGKPVAEWTLSDLDRLREWGKPAPAQDAKSHQAPRGAVKCDDCGYSTDDPQEFEDHLQEMGHEHRTAVRS